MVLGAAFPAEAACAACGSTVVVLFGMPPTESEVVPAAVEERPEFVDILGFLFAEL